MNMNIFKKFAEKVKDVFENITKVFRGKKSEKQEVTKKTVQESAPQPARESDNINVLIDELLRTVTEITDIEPWLTRGSSSKIEQANNTRRRCASAISNMLNNLRNDDAFRENIIVNHRAIRIEIQKMMIDSDDSVITDSYDMITAMLLQGVDVDKTEYEYEV